MIYRWNLKDLKAQPVSFNRTRLTSGPLVVSSDGDRLLAMRRDGSLCHWDLPMERLMALASGTAGRNLTLAEWQQFFPDEPYRPTSLDWPYPPPSFLNRPFSIDTDAYENIMVNMSESAWNSFFPGHPYRELFPDRAKPEGTK